MFSQAKESLYNFFIVRVQLMTLALGKFREMLTLHTNLHAVHGRFTLKDDCERQVWNAGAVS